MGTDSITIKIKQLFCCYFFGSDNLTSKYEKQKLTEQKEKGTNLQSEKDISICLSESLIEYGGKNVKIYT